MKIQFYKKTGEKDVAVDYPKALESEISDSKILEYIRYVRNANRSVIASTKDRSEVSGGGKKPWKQKGTGRARHGSRRSPIWVHGGVTFGPTTDRNFATQINKKQRKAAILAVISKKVKENSALGISEMKFSAPKTADAAKILEKMPIKGKVGLFLAKDELIEKSFQNIPYCSLIKAEKIDVIKILSSDTIIFTKESLSALLDQFDNKKSEKPLKVVAEGKKDE